MIKILHSADWHLDAPISGHEPQQSEFLRNQLSKVPGKIAKIAAAEQCDLILLSGDLFDGAYSQETLRIVQKTLSDMGVPVFISPGNHDFVSPDSPYLQSGWPDNVHIFKEQKMESLVLPELSCKIYGAGYISMDCPALLKDFQADGDETWHIGVLHGEADTSRGSYCPISKEQLLDSALSYLALGHIHKSGSVRAGETLCAWPGCPMGKGYDELGAKGVLLVTLDQGVQTDFIPLDVPRFYDENVEAGLDAYEALSSVLPSLTSEDFYRITLTGYSAPLDLKQLTAAFSHISNLILRDETRPEMDLWSAVGEDSLEGVYFSLLQQATRSESRILQANAQLAARISRQILDGQEVKLP